MESLRNKLIFVIFLTLIFSTYSFSSDSYDTNSLRCAGKIVGYGDTRVDVLRKCGNPIVKSRYDDWWTYDFGTSRFIHHIKFSKEKVIRIKVDNSRGRYTK
jgi:hypothetical protein